MVMHARKIPRLNDGYYDRGESHPYEEKMSSKHHHYSDRFGEHQRESQNFRQGGSGGDRRGTRERNDQSSERTSPPRYQNKASYMARSKEHAEKASNDKRAAYDRSRSGKDGRNREQKERDHRAEVRKTAMRVCGDWSEHVSSKGKCYYYNCKTEESKWEKPKEWVDSESSVRQKDPKDRKMAPSSKKVHDEKPKHSSSVSAPSYPDRSWTDHQHNSRSSNMFGSPAAARQPQQQDNSGISHGPREQKYHGNRQSHGLVNSSSSSNSNSNSHSVKNSSYSSHQGQGSHTNTNWHGSDHNKSIDSMPSTGDRTFITPERPSQHGYDRQHRGPNSAGNTPVNWHHHGNKGSASRVADHNGSRHKEDFQQSEDMDISPGSTPTEESVERHISASHAPGHVSFPPTSSSACMTTPPKSSMTTLLSTLSNLTSVSGVTPLDLPTLAKLSSLSGLASTSPGGSSTSPASLLPQLIQQLTSSSRSTSTSSTPVHGSSKLLSQQVSQQAIQVLQQLQQNLVVQQKQQQQRQLQQQLVTQLQQLQTQLQHQQNQQHRPTTNSQPQSHSHSHSRKKCAEDGSQSPYSPPDESDGTPLQSPEYGVGSSHHQQHVSHHHQHHHHHHPHDEAHTGRGHGTGTGRESPRSEHSIRTSSRRASPTHSHTSSQNLSSVGTSQLSAAHRKEDVHLTTSLSNYYDEGLIGHVAGLIYDQSERQSDVVAKDVFTICHEQGTQVAAELKGARSLVRVGEIISTLHEQRILFIRQQIKDLDGSSRTHSNYMYVASAGAGPTASSTLLPQGGPS